MTPIQAVEEALNLALERHKQAPSFRLYASVENQLRYLLEVVAGREADRSRLRTLTFGVYAAKEFDDTDPEFANALHRAYWVADRMMRGLKVGDVPV